MNENFNNLRRVGAAALLSFLAPWALAQPGADPLVVQDVICAGNEQMSCEFIRDHLYLRAGERLVEDEIRNAELRMSALRIFESVKIRLEKGAQRGAVIVVMEVEEADPFTKEWLFAASSREDSRRGVFAGRIAHQNLWGKGKIAEISALALVPADGDAYNEAYDFSLRYADPQLFGSKRYFATTSLGWRKRRYRDSYGNHGDLDTGRFDISVGRRVADFSYFTFGMTYRQEVDWTAGHWNSDGSFIVYQPDDTGSWAMRMIYGWSTEDDLHFPTQGTTFQIIAGGDYEPSEPIGRSHLQFRKTWPMAGAYWTVKVGGDPSPEYRSSFGESQLFALGYARPVATGDEILRGRWYVEPGFGVRSHNSAGDTVFEYGLKAGFRADTRTFGLVDFYILATRDTIR
jgi:outer membrane protein assembly factor BamA